MVRRRWFLHYISTYCIMEHNIFIIYIIYTQIYFVWNAHINKYIAWGVPRLARDVVYVAAQWLWVTITITMMIIVVTVMEIKIIISKHSTSNYIYSLNANNVNSDNKHSLRCSSYSKSTFHLFWCKSEFKEEPVLKRWPSVPRKD